MKWSGAGTERPAGGRAGTSAVTGNGRGERENSRGKAQASLPTEPPTPLT